MTLKGSAGPTESFVTFLRQLSAQLQDFSDRPLSLYVCVQPVPADTNAYLNAYDYKAIGDLADKVILIAHDYDPRNLDHYAGGTYYEHCATVPLGSVYLALRDVIERVDPGKWLWRSAPGTSLGRLMKMAAWSLVHR